MGDGIIRSFKYRLLPSRAQHEALRATLDAQRALYNAALEERISYYGKTGNTRTLRDQFAALTECRAALPEMAALPANLQRGTLSRLDAAFAGFFRRVAAGAKPGFPRFKGRERFHSFRFLEFSGVRFDGKRLRWKGLPGGLRVHLHRPLPDGRPLGCVIRRDARGWTVSLQYQISAAPLPGTGRQCGIDVGLSSFATFNDGVAIPAPRVARRHERELRRRQRALARCQRGSRNRQKARLRVARLHQKITNTRSTFLHQASARIVRDHDLIAVEALNVKGLAASVLARSVNDASWAKFFDLLSYKAESAGREFIAVDPRNTSQACSGCGSVVPKALSTRTHDCPHCGLSIDRDHNAARNILHRAVVGPDLAKPPVAVA